jgi:hypothetical protein
MNGSGHRAARRAGQLSSRAGLIGAVVMVEIDDNLIADVSNGDRPGDAEGGGACIAGVDGRAARWGSDFCREAMQYLGSVSTRGRRR